MAFLQTISSERCPGAQGSGALATRYGMFVVRYTVTVLVAAINECL
jgi:hypothetical protein